MKTHTSFTPPLNEAEIHRDSDHVDSPDGLLYSVNPIDRTVIGEVEMMGPDRVPELVEGAREAQRAWMRRPLMRRVAAAQSVFQSVMDWRGELLELLIDETGKTPVEARWELWKIAEEVADITERAEEELSPQTMSTMWPKGSRSEARWFPRGVVLVVASAYEPMQSVVGPALAALVAGNAVIVVADRRSPLTVQSLANIAATAGVPDALWQCVVGGRRLIDDLAERADAVISYGSSSVTRRLARRQGERMIPVMGRWATRDVMIVLNDADIEQAARAAVHAACCGAGRRRRALSRIYVQDTVIDLFVDAVVEEVGKLRNVDMARAQNLEVGPLFEDEDLDRIEGLVDEAAACGARLVAGGRARPRSLGAFFEPTVLTGVHESMRLWQEGAVGPVVAIAEIRAPAEAVMRTRSIEGYGSVAIFSENRAVCTDLAARLGAPLVGINEVVGDVPTSAHTVRTALDGPVDPIGAKRLRPLSRRIMTVERRWKGLSQKLQTRSPQKMERILDSAIALVHRRGWVRRFTETLWPPY